METTLFGKTKIIYFNPSRRDTYGARIARMEFYDGKHVFAVSGNKADADLAERIRAGEFKTIKVHYQ